MVASAATGVGIVVTIGGAVWTAYDLWDSKDDIIDLYDILTSDELGLSTDDMMGAVGAIATGADILPECENKSPEKGTEKKKDGGRIRSKIKKKKVKCFCPKDSAKGGRPEYDRQLKDQQDALNNMNAEDYLTKRKSYTGKDPCNGYKDTKEGKTTKRKQSVTKKAREKRLNEKSKQYTGEFREKGLSPKKSKGLGAAKANRELGGQAATHTPDLVAGGDDVISMIGDLGFGDSGINSHIGSQWNGPRIKGIDSQACGAVKDGNGKEKMNVELRACGKKEAKKQCK